MQAFTLPASVMTAVAESPGAMLLASPSMLPTGVQSTTRSAALTAVAGSVETESARPLLVSSCKASSLRAQAEIFVLGERLRRAKAIEPPMSPGPKMVTRPAGAVSFLTAGVLTRSGSGNQKDLSGVGILDLGARGETANIHITGGW